MIRLILRTDELSAAVHVGGPVLTSYKTFDVSLPEVEAYLSEKFDAYTTRQFVGVEVLGDEARGDERG